jgi:NAD(P)-dependent dehydrogenase (short-subunit alcohol dehydrogenase family)
VRVNVLDKASLVKAKEVVNKELGMVDILINCAGGNNPKATTGAEVLRECTDEALDASFFGLDPDCFRQVTDLNFLGTVLPSMVFGTDMAKKKKGTVLNISSMASFRPLTKVVAYSAAKASINNFTQWLAVHLAKLNVRVNAIAPGFLLTKQNEYLMVKDKATGELSDRGKSVIAHTPMARFGNPEELCGAILFLVSDLSAFITGVVIPIDGGFNVFAGV